MGKITSKFQVTVPKAVADALGLKPGDELDWHAGEGSIRVTPSKAQKRLRAPTVPTRLKGFDAATARQAKRDKSRRSTTAKGRGWTREELYSRGRAD